MKARRRLTSAASVFVGALAASALVALYLSLITLAQGPDHAIYQLRADFPFVGAVALGFGIQVGLFAELRATHSRSRRSGAMTAASAGAGGAAMLACCAHHLVDVLPLVGLSAATVFLNDYRAQLVALSLGMNALGIALMCRQLVAARRGCRAAVASPDPVGA
jgi:hypothetical protein